jgi:hypothetical protein
MNEEPEGQSGTESVVDEDYPTIFDNGGDSAELFWRKENIVW